MNLFNVEFSIIKSQYACIDLNIINSKLTLSFSSLFSSSFNIFAFDIIWLIKLYLSILIEVKLSESKQILMRKDLYKLTAKVIYF